MTCKEVTRIAAVVNGHGAIWPEAIAVSDGSRVVFQRDGKEVYTCNATYAAHHFEAVKIGGLDDLINS